MIPKYVRPFLWSADIPKLDISKHKNRIITQVLNLGSLKAAQWLFRVYDRNEIEKLVRSPLPGEWNKKSLHFWRFIFDLKPYKSQKNSKRNVH